MSAGRRRSTAKSGVVVQLANRRAENRDTTDFFLAMASKACRGELIGAACVVLMPGSKYESFVAGECRHNPTFTRGLLRNLDDHLGELD